MRLNVFRQSFRCWGLVIAAGICAASLIKAPYIEPRAFSLTWVILIMFIVRFALGVLDGLSENYKFVFLVFLGLLSLGVASQAASEYLEYSNKVKARSDYIFSKIGSVECKSGLKVKLIETASAPRILNNREEWVGASLSQVSNYFGCELRIPGSGSE
ncbi:hypothetical protein D3C84_870280 [compost metagenome]